MQSLPRLVRRFIIMLTVMLMVTSIPLASAQKSLAQLVDEVSRAVVLIVTYDANGDPLGSGTGTIVRSDGIIFTNRHVVEGGSFFEIYLLDDPNEQPVLSYYAVLFNFYNEIDFAVLQINRDASGRNLLPGSLDLPYVQIDPDDPEIANITRMSDIVVLGYPSIGDYYLTTPRGSITSVQNTRIDGQSWTIWYQTDAEIAPGHSGGIAITTDGVPFGIATQVTSEDRTGGRYGRILALPFLWAVVNSQVDLSELAPTPEPEQEQPVAAGLADDEVLTCGSLGTNNGTIVATRFRPGNYTATAIGIDGFTPVLFVTDDNREGPCAANTSAANDYIVTLPTVGSVGGGPGAQVNFTINQLSLVYLIVGGVDGQHGEFLLLVEGLRATNDDGLGDPFFFFFNNSMVAADLLDVYMLSLENGLDPLLRAAVITDDDTVPLRDGNTTIECDDAGTSTCFSATDSGYGLANSSIRVENRVLDADSTHSMMSLSPQGIVGTDLGGLFSVLFGRYSGTGAYVIVFRMGV